MRFMRKKLIIKIFFLFIFFCKCSFASSCGEEIKIISKNSFLKNVKFKIKNTFNNSCFKKSIEGDLYPKKLDISNIKKITFSRKLSKNYHKDDCIAYDQYYFDKEDQEDDSWRPQGATMVKEFAMISWYHRAGINGELTLKNGEKGMRLSLINLEDGTYDHIGFRDELNQIIVGHGDGLAIYKNLLFLADYNYGIHIFDMNQLDVKKMLLKRINSIKVDQCKFPLYKFGNLSFGNFRGKKVLSFSNYTNISDKLHLQYMTIESLINGAQIDHGIIHLSLPYTKVQGVTMRGPDYYFTRQSAENKSELIKTNLLGQVVYALPPGVEDSQAFDNQLITVTEFNKNKSIILIDLGSPN